MIFFFKKVIGLGESQGLHVCLQPKYRISVHFHVTVNDCFGAVAVISKHCVNKHFVPGSIVFFLVHKLVNKRKQHRNCSNKCNLFMQRMKQNFLTLSHTHPSDDAPGGSHHAFHTVTLRRN